MHITILTIGSRGDVQPYIALAVGLQKAGHRVQLATHAKFEPEIRASGLEFALISGNPQEALASEAGQALMQTKNPLNFPRQFAGVLDPIMKTALEDSWNACLLTDVIISGTVAFWGFDIAQKLGVPFYLASMQPLNPTSAFPNAATSPELERLGSLYNRFTYIVIGKLFWFLFRKSINQFRETTLNEAPLKLWDSPFKRMKLAQVNFLNAFSPSVIPKPVDWSEHNHVTGYWFLDPPADFIPSPDLVEFLNSGAPPVYIGFGSMSGKQAQEVAEIALAALVKTQQRGIFMTGWGGIENADLPDTIFEIESIPHSWLFPQMSCIVHHGGAGTTAATFRAGVPGIIIPFLADQPFWGYLGVKLGVSPAMIRQNELTVDSLAIAITTAVQNKSIRDRATALGEKIRLENGVTTAVEIIEKTMNNLKPSP
ncbi:glycosyltransferase [Nostoc sp.]|uniref:glycosyltransferase n=1 Tax=Nostoc sp. TaxID=1180 RepID=UPI003594415B